MTAVVLSMDSLRVRAVDFSVPLYVDQQVVGYKRPVYEADMLGFVKPYKYEVSVRTNPFSTHHFSDFHPFSNLGRFDDRK